MSKKKQRSMPRAETMIIWVAVISFAFWAISKCSKDDFKDIREKALDLPGIEQNEEQVLDDPNAPLPVDSADSSAIGPPDPTPAASEKTAPATTPTATEPALSRLYVTIDGLKIRSEPSLTGTVVEKLPLYATVYFMNEVTDSTQQINLGRAVADEPWVKVKSTKGKIGWVYGAGVHYYKIKNEDAY